LESGLLLCRAYEAYLEYHAPVSISFEHAWFLLCALVRRDEIGAARCGDCGGVRLHDMLGRRKPTCANCDAAGRTGPRQAGPRQAGPRQAGPRQAGPRQAGPRQAEPHEAEPHEAAPC
jgi:hypothetical protein